LDISIRRATQNSNVTLAKNSPIQYAATSALTPSVRDDAIRDRRDCCGARLSYVRATAATRRRQARRLSYSFILLQVSSLTSAAAILFLARKYRGLACAAHAHPAPSRPARLMMATFPEADN
jgi:hypothetical protein